MQEEFSKFESELFGILSQRSDKLTGAEVQNRRYRYDRKLVFLQTFSEACKIIGHEVFDKMLEQFMNELQPDPDDDGYWGQYADFLTWIEKNESINRFTKSLIRLYAAGLAAQQLEGDLEFCEEIPHMMRFLKLFSVENRTVILSHKGYPEEALGYKGLIQIYSEQGEVKIREYR